MKHNGKPIIDDEDTHVKSIDYSILKRSTDFQTGDSGNIGQWKEDLKGEGSHTDPAFRISPFARTNGLVAGVLTPKTTIEIPNTNKNGTYRKELPEPLNSSHSRFKTTDPNGNHGHVGLDNPENHDPMSEPPETKSPSNEINGVRLNKSEDQPMENLSNKLPTDDPINDGLTNISDRVIPTFSPMTETHLDEEPGTTTPARTPEHVPESPNGEQTLENDQILTLNKTRHEEMEVVISCFQEDSNSQPVTQTSPMTHSQDSSQRTLEVTKSNEPTITDSQPAVTADKVEKCSITVEPGNLRLSDAYNRLCRDMSVNNLQALTTQSRTAEVIRRLIFIRARFMNASSRIEAKKQRIRSQRERRHIPGVTEYERNLLLPVADSLADTGNDTPDTDESDIEDIGFLNDKIGSEQRRIRLREKLEEEKSRKIESRRTWLLKQIQNCEKKQNTIETRLKNEMTFTSMVMDEMEENDGHCARTRAFVRSKCESRDTKCDKATQYKKTNRPIPLAKTSIEKYSNIHRLDNSYHHILSNPRSIPLSTRLSTILHNLDPDEKAMELKKIAKRNERREKRVSNDKKRPKRNEDFENNIVVPSSSFISNIVMPKYKNIDTPGYRSDETSDPLMEEDDEDISHESYVRRHIKAEKQEKLRYYQSAIKKSRKRKKEQIDPRLASPKPESYQIRVEDHPGYGYKKIEYPIPLSQVGELGYKSESFKKKKMKKQWRSSTAEGGLRLKLSLRKT